jgi:enoyl-CoA hydratase
MTTAETLVRLEHRDEICVFALARPPVNAMNLDVLSQIDAALRDLEQQREVRAVVLTGSGRCFSAGLDLKAIPAYSPADQRETVLVLNRVVTRLYRMPVPTIAAVNGHAIAGGLILVLACDYRIGTRAPCELGLTEARVGIPFPAAPLAVLKSELAPAVVRRLTLTGRNIDSQKALDEHVLDEIEAPERVVPRALEVAKDLAAIPRDAFGRVKHQVRGEVIERLSGLIEANTDPLLGDWLTGETSDAAQSVLRQRR